MDIRIKDVVIDIEEELDLFSKEKNVKEGSDLWDVMGEDFEIFKIWLERKFNVKIGEYVIYEEYDETIEFYEACEGAYETIAEMIDEAAYESEDEE
jgi:hypothetical protein